MLGISFKIAKEQLSDDAVLFNLVVEDCDQDLAKSVEFELIGDNLAFEPTKIALADVYVEANRGALHQIKAKIAGRGEAAATMNAFLDGELLATVQHNLTI